jgi:hypothetical protein
LGDIEEITAARGSLPADVEEKSGKETAYAADVALPIFGRESLRPDLQSKTAAWTAQSTHFRE